MSQALTDNLIIRRSTSLDGSRIQNGVKPTNTLVVELEKELMMNPKLKFEEFDKIIKNSISKNSPEIIKVLKTFDLEHNGMVTKGELRRIIDRYCIPLTTSQFEVLLNRMPGLTKMGSVDYRTFIDSYLELPKYAAAAAAGNSVPKVKKDELLVSSQIKLPTLQRSMTNLCGQQLNSRPHLSSSCSNRSVNSVQSRCGSSASRRSWNYSAFNVDDIIPIIQAKVLQNSKAILKVFRLFDFNSDQQIQKFRLKKVLENFCCPLSDNQFEKLLSRFSFSETTTVNYVEFLKNLGLPLNSQGQLQNTRTTNAIKCEKEQSGDPLLQAALIPKGILGTLEMEQLAYQFRTKIEDKFSVLKKAFVAIDPTGEGYVKIDELYQVVSKFIFPMSRNVFKQLMEKNAFKATGKIAWLTFLKKFLDPQSRKLNGSTFPTKSNLTCFPIQGVGNEASVEELLGLIYKHINNNFSSFREAFLKLNKAHKSKISKSEFMKILHRFEFNISPQQTKSIFDYLDPNNQGSISYHHFLRLFEVKESLAAHPWLNSNHKVVEVKTDLPLTGDLIKDNLRQHCVERWPELVAALKTKDSTGSGYISVLHLKQVLTQLFCYLHDEDIDKLIEKLTPCKENGKISYLELLTLLDIDPQPSDIHGLSTQITESSEQDRKDRLADHNEKMESMSKKAGLRTADMSVQEIVIRMRDKLLQDRSSSYDIYRRFECPDERGGVNRAQLKKVLAAFGYNISDSQLDEVCLVIDFPTNRKKRIDFNQFLVLFLDNRSSSDNLDSSPNYLPKSNHHYNEIRGQDSRIMDADALEMWIRKQIVQIEYYDLKSAFKKLDSSGKGYVNRKDLKELLDRHNVLVDQEIFNCACDKLKIEKGSKLNYTQFLDIFQLRDSLEEGHKWLVSQHRYNTGTASLEVPEMTADEVSAILPDKIHQSYSQTSPTFCQQVTNNQGYVTYSDFVRLLTKLQIKMSRQESRKLWKRYDRSGGNKLGYNEFLDSLGLGAIFGAADSTGPSTQIIQGSHDAVVDHLASQELRHQFAQDNQAILGEQLHVEHIYENIKRYLKTSYNDLGSAFIAVSGGKTKTSKFTLNDLDRLLNQMHLFLTKEKFIQLATKMGFHGPNESIGYSQFCTLFQDQVNGPKEMEVPERVTVKDETKPQIVTFTDAGGMSVDKIHKIVNRKMKQQISDIAQTFAVLDSENSGFVSLDQFRNVLSAFCITMTDAQFNSFLKELSVYITSTGKENIRKFDYSAFIKQFNEVGGKQNSHSTTLSITGGAASNQTMNYKQCVNYINESVKVRPKLFLNALKQKDYAMIGVVSKTDLQDVLNQLIFEVPKEQFDQYWTELSVNDFDNLNYVDYIKNVAGYSEDDNEKKEYNSGIEKVNKSVTTTAVSDLSSRRNEFGDTDEEDDPIESVKERLECLLNKHWQTIFNRCRQEASKSIEISKEMEGKHLVGLNDFCNIISQFDSTLNEENLQNLNLYKTLQNGGKFIRYGDLIRSVVLSSRGSIVTQENVLEVQKKFNKAAIKISSVDGSKNYFPLLYKLRKQVLEHWKELRRLMIERDTDQKGTVSGSVCMSVLNKVCGRLNPDLFYHLMTLYDLDGSGRFHYRRFIEDFLKTAT